MSNLYYTSFSKTILTESLFFTFINLSIFFLFNLKTKLKIIFFHYYCGIISSLKPIGIPFALILIIMGIIKIKKNQIFLMILLFLLPNIVENLFSIHILTEENQFLNILLLEKFFSYQEKILLK